MSDIDSRDGIVEKYTTGNLCDYVDYSQLSYSDKNACESIN